MEGLARIIEGVHLAFAIGVDTNAHSPLWYSRGDNNTDRAKGRLLEQFTEKRSLVFHNQPGQPDTYSRRGMGSSNINVTVFSEGLGQSLINWTVENVTDRATPKSSLRATLQIGKHN